jgi:Flp pilus assembly protein TadB
MSNLNDSPQQPSPDRENWASFSPNERRKTVIKIRDAGFESSRKSLPLLFIMAIPFVAVSLLMLIVSLISRSNLLSSLGFVLGLSLSAIGIWVLIAYRIKSYPKILFDDFSDEDAIAYLREEQDVNKRFLYQLKRPASYAIFVYFGIVLISIVVIHTIEFILMLLITTLGFFLLFLAIFTLHRSRRKSGKAG